METLFEHSKLKYFFYILQIQYLLHFIKKSVAYMNNRLFTNQTIGHGCIILTEKN